MEYLNFEMITEEGYSETMKSVVEPFLDGLRQEKIFRYKDGQKVYCQYYIPEDAKGTICTSHGFSECAEKFREMIYYFLKSGYAVVAVDHRGHGRSRFDDDNAPAYHATHVDDFEDYVRDLDMVVRNIMKPLMPAPYNLFCHSMGGCIGAMYLELHPAVFEKAVLSSPMMELPGMKTPASIIKNFGRTAKAMGKGSNLAPSQGLFNPQRDLESSGAGSEARYAYYHDIQLSNPLFQNSGSSISWASEAYIAMGDVLKEENCDNVQTKILLFQAENDAFVWPGGQNTFISQVADGQLVFVAGAKHEIYMEKDEIVKDYLVKIFEFLD